MNRIFILLILCLTIQYSFGQACGLYRIKYVGKINSESLKIEKIKLPTIQFLHGLEEEKSEECFKEIKLNQNKFDVELVSHLTSLLCEKSECLLKSYKSKRKNIPIILIVIDNNKPKELRIELSWNSIQISKLEDDKFGNLFELNLHEIDLK